MFPLEPNFMLPVNLAAGRRLAADEEVAMFRWMNFLKYRAGTLRATLRLERPRVALMHEIEHLLDQAVDIRNQLVCVFSKLAYCAARKFGHGGQLLEELESEALATLLRAVERFDADRGYRFTTYATHAIRRNLCRYLRRRRKEMSRVLLLPHMEVVKDDRRSSVQFELRLAKSSLILQEIVGRLDAREQLIIRSRFGLGEQPGSQTLQALADQLAVSRERVRQVEGRALAKLRQMAQRHGLSESSSDVP
jgi:RNA polymerase sigma factor (sigma-70 family)